MAARTLDFNITEKGHWDADLVKFLRNVVDVVNELQDDHATTATAVDELNTLTDELHDDHATNKTMTDELHVDVDLITLAVDGIVAKLDGDAGITDTNYEAVHGVGGSGAALPAAAIAATDVATITATKATAGPATLTEITDLKLTKG